MVFCSLALSAQNTISGLITDSNDALPMIGVTVLEQGTTNGTISDIDGKFELTTTSPNPTLEFSFVGYKSLSLQYDGQGMMNVFMNIDAAELDEIIVVGYGTQKKKVVTGAIAKVDGEALEDMQIDRIESALQGRTSGVRVTTESGQPGSASTVRIRGTTTLGNSDPLYIVDGVAITGGIDYLSPDDIASIEVLKDAASASIYGARSANGVILVTTKQGVAGKPVVNYNAFYGASNPWKKVSVLNATEYATLMNESFAAAGQNIPFPDPTIFGEGTDWQDAVFRRNAPTVNHNVSLNAGGEISKFYGSFSFLNAEGIVSEDQSKYKRFNIRLNNTNQVTDRIMIGTSIAYTRVSAQGVSVNSEFGSPLSRALNLDPITPIYETDPAVLSNSVYTNFPVVGDENGLFGISNFVTSEVLNPVAALSIQQNLGWSDKFVGSTYIEYEPIEKLKLRSSIGADLAFWGSEGFNPVHYLNATNRLDLNSYNRAQNRGLVWTWENTASYDLDFGQHKLTALIGNSAIKEQGSGIGGAVQDIPVDNLEDASLGFSVPRDNQSFFGFEYNNTIASIFTRLSYNFKERYLLTATLRRDGSSKFGSNNLYGVFPSVSLGWNLSDEEFFNVNAVNYFKLRASWGINGNDRIADFLFLPQVVTGANYTFGLQDQLAVGTVVGSLANPDLRWEETVQYNIGFDAVLFKGLNVTFDAYQKDTDGILLQFEVPGFVGFGSPTANVGELQNRGLELDVSYEENIGDFYVNVGGNISYNENEILFITPDKDFLPGARFGPQGLEISRAIVGQPVGVFFGFETAGLFQNQADLDAHVNSEGIPLQPDAAPGDLIFVDINEDGVIDEDDRTVIGDPTPTWTYGNDFTFGYKNFELQIFGQGVWGNEIYTANRRFDLQMANLTGDALGRWTGEGTSNDYPRLVVNDPNRNFSRSSDFFVESGAYFRIKNLQLSYTLPDWTTERVNIGRAKVYGAIKNALTITQYSGFDPEIGGGSFGIDRGLYPQARQFIFGLNVTFE